MRRWRKISIKYYRLNLEDVVKKVTRILEKEDNVLIAIIYGSALRRKIVRDLDILIYAPGIALRDLLKLEAKLEREIGIPVDLALFDQVSPRLAYKALAGGVKILSRNNILFNALTTLAIAQIQDTQVKRVGKLR